MWPKSFEYYRPSRIADALSLLERHGDDVKVLAGGQSLVPLMKLRQVTPRYVVDLTRLQELSYINDTADGGVAIGAMTTHYSVESSSTIRTTLPLLAEAAGSIGDPHVRNRGTIGGNVCHGDPKGDLPVALLALAAKLKVQNSTRSKIIDAHDFFHGPFSTALKSDELLTEILVPPLQSKNGWQYRKFTVVGGTHVVSVAASISVDTVDKCTSCGLAVGGLASTPLKAVASEQYMEGMPITDEVIRKAAEKVFENLAHPWSDVHGSSDFRKHLTRVLAAKTIREAIERAHTSDA